MTAPTETVEQLAEKVDRLVLILGMQADHHYQYLPAAVDYYCCGGCNQVTSEYVPWPCPVERFRRDLSRRREERA